MSLLAAWSPYLIVVVLLLLTRIVAPVKTLTTTVLDLSWTHILGYPTISSSWQLLYSPGTILFIAAILRFSSNVNHSVTFQKHVKIRPKQLA